MGCGKSAWADELAAEEWQRVVNKFNEIPKAEVIATLQNTLESLKRIEVSPSLSLSRAQWSNLDNAINKLKSLV